MWDRFWPAADIKELHWRRQESEVGEAKLRASSVPQRGRGPGEEPRWGPGEAPKS